MGKELAKQDNLITPDTITKDDVKRLFCPTATEKEIAMFLQIAKLNQLNPLKREIYLVKYKVGTAASIVTGYETYLKRASRSGQYGGFKVWVEGESSLMKACIDVYRKDFDNPLHHEVDYAEYAQMKWENGKRVPNKFWHEKPKTMLKKVVISQALRFAFPDELAGMPYVREEINEEPNGVEVVKTEQITVEPLVESPQSPEDGTGANKPIQSTTTANPVEKVNKTLSTNERFKNALKALGETDYRHILDKFGVKSANEFKAKEKAEEALKALEEVSIIGEVFDDKV